MAKSIAGSLLEQLEKGINYYDDLAKATGFTNAQLYYAGTELVKAKKAYRALPGHGGAICLNGQVLRTTPPETEVKPKDKAVKPSVVKAPKVSVQKVQEPVAPTPVSVAPVVDSFDFNHHFNQFIGGMTSFVLGRIEHDVKAQVTPIAEAISVSLVNEVEATVRAKLEPMTKALNDELSNNLKLATDKLLSSISSNIARAIGCMNEPIAPVVPEQVATKDELVTNVNEKLEYLGQEPPTLTEAKVVRIRLPKICVANLKPIQMGELQQEFCRTFDISFWNDRTGSSNQQLSDYSRNCEKVFWHTKHCNHSCESIVKRDGGEDKLVRVNGGLAQMKEALMAFYNLSVKAVAA